MVKALTQSDAMNVALEEHVDLALVDLKLAGATGIGLMQELHRINPQVPVIIYTGHGTIESAVEAMRRGAYSYVVKPFDYSELLHQIKNGLEHASLTAELERVRNSIRRLYGYENVVAKGKKMKAVFRQVAHAAQTDSSVCIEGESGTGKELIAKILHLISSRRDGPFVIINCAAIPETLLESELFGYERGAFTGATVSKKGLFALAHKGTIFLDEISEMPLSMQAKVLRVIQEKEFFPLGSDKTVKVDIRLVASSNKSLKDQVERGYFREDLYYRIHVILIQLPPLRERREDIPLLAEYFRIHFCQRMNKNVIRFSSAAINKLIQYSWPGNIRELKNTVENAVVMATGDVVDDNAVLKNQPVRLIPLKPYKGAKKDFEKKYLIDLFKYTRGNVSWAAKLSGKYRSDLYDWLKKYDMSIDEFRQEKNSLSI